MRAIFVWGGEGGLVVCRWGELGLGRRRRNRGGESRQRGHILTFSDGFTDGISIGDSAGYSDEKIDTSPYRSAILNPSVIPSAFQAVNRSRHRTDLPFRIPRWFHRHFKRRTGQVTVRGCRFESVADSVCKNNPAKTSTSATCFFFNSECFPSVIQSVTTDGKCPSVVTDWITDGKGSVSNFDLKLSTEIVRR